MTRRSIRSRAERSVGLAREAVPLDGRDRPWLALSLLPAVVVVAVYLATNPYPAYGAGLYVKIAGEIAANGYAPPTRIPGYTADGVPFAYPPLQFYLLAVLLDAGADVLAVSRFLPGVAVVAVQLPLYVLARDVVESRPAAAVAAAGVALNPQVLEWHVSAGGVVRAFAFLYAVTAISAGYRCFAHGRRRAVAVGVVAFGATVLTHPTYALFVVASYLLFWAVLDRSVAGLLRGAVVGFGGAAIASPWLAWVVGAHGVGVFAAASGTHGGVGGGAAALFADFSPYTLVPLTAAAYLLAVRRDVLLPAWVVAAELLFEQPRFSYAVGSLAAAAVGLDLFRRAVPRGERETPVLGGLDRRAAAAALLVLVGTAVGGAYLAYETTLTPDSTTPAFLDDEAVAAAEWAAAETPPDATFVVLGDAAEWFPALSDRTILVAPWGVEWESSAAFDRHLRAYENVSACRSVDCVETVSASVGASPDYVYVPKGRYTVRGDGAVQDGTLDRSFERSPRWELAYENEGVAVYRAVGDG